MTPPQKQIGRNVLDAIMIGVAVLAAVIAWFADGAR